MQKKLKAPPKLTPEETKKVQNYIWMADWHFEETIKKECTELCAYTIHWEKIDGNYQWTKATVFGLQGIRAKTEERCICNTFIRHKTRVYQTKGIIDAAEIIRLIKKEVIYEEYKMKLIDQRWKEKQIKNAIKIKEKSKVRNLRVVANRKVA